MAATTPITFEGYGIDAAPNELVLGTFDRRLTVFDQQVRALNLAYRLKVGGIIPDKSKTLAVIGAGIAGLTFATGCIWLGQRVILLEKQPVPCHLQRGCDIRWVHPHIYHWPRPGSEQPYAGLPLLSWMEGTASEVARQIVAQWDRVATFAAKLGLLDEVYSAHHRFLPESKTKLEIKGSRGGSPFQLNLDATRVIYAVGFGVEEGQGGLKAHSYWENDSFNQLLPDHPPGKTIRWLISGTGDGALIDLQRLCIESFRQGRVIQDLFEKQKPLVVELRKIAEEIDAHGLPIQDRLDAMDAEGKFETVDARLAHRRRKDTTVWLNWRSTGFEEALNKSRASFLNRLILHRLYKMRAFEYLGGELWHVARHREQRKTSYRTTIVDISAHCSKHWEFDRIVRRFGTRKRVWLEQAGYGNCEELQSQVESLRIKLGAEWDPGWWSLHAHLPLLKAMLGRAPMDEKVQSDPREYVTPVTEAIATTFVRTVAGLLSRHGPSEKKFRITLHRVVPTNGRLRLQQIAEYAGTRQDDTPGVSSVSIEESEGSAMQFGTVGRVFDVNHLTIGLCVRRRLPCLLRSSLPPREEAKDLRQDMDKLFLDASHARHMVSSVHSVLTIPFLAAAVTVSGLPCVNLVLYADSDEKKFFTHAVMDDLYRACCSFRELIDSIAMRDDGNHRVVEWDWEGIDAATIIPHDESVKDLKTLSTTAADYGQLLKSDNELNDELKFQGVDAVDVVARTP